MADPWRRPRQEYLPWIALLVGGVVTLAASWLLARADQRAALARFEARGVEQSLQFEHWLRDTHASLEDMAAAVQITPGLTREDFRTLASPLLERQQWLRAVSWNPRVRAAERESHERAMRRLYPGYRVTQLDETGSLEVAPARPDHHTVAFIEPLAGNEAAVGFDVASEPSRLEALRKAVETGRPTMTSAIQPVQASRSEAFLSFQPVYRHGAHPEAGPERWRELTGFVVGVLEIAPLIDALAAESAHDLFQLEITDATASGARPPFALPSPPLGLAARAEYVSTLEAGGRFWNLRISASDAYLAAQRSWVPAFALGAGVLLTVLTASYLSTSSARERRVRELAQALTRSRERLRLMLDVATEGGWDHDLTSGATHLTDGWLRAFGYDRSEIEPTVRFAMDLVHPDDRPTIAEAVGSHLNGHTIRYEATVRVRARNGEYRWLMSRGAVVERDSEGKPVRLVGVDRDVTESRRAEEEHRRLERSFQDAQKLESLGVLAGGIAHDFNNLLTGILGNADLALRELSPESPSREELTQIHLAATRAADLTRQMLAYSGRGRFESKVLDVSRLGGEMLHLLQASISKNALLRHELADRLPPVFGDATQIRQVVMNLITNASDALGNQPGVISIRTGVARFDPASLSHSYLEAQEDDRPYVFIEVSDSGCGMDEATRSRIFEPFFTTRVRGRGLGLAAALGIVRGHRGALRVESSPGRGTTVTVILPEAEGPTEFCEDARTEPEAPVSLGTVLVIDDEPAVRRLAGRLIERLGGTALMAADGQEGIARFREHADEIAAVLLDVTMPGLSGGEVLQAIRRIRPDARVIFSSGYDAESSLRGLEERPDGFVGKPYTAADLARVARIVLEGSGSGRRAGSDGGAPPEARPVH